jgi:hypothetical protein
MNDILVLIVDTSKTLNKIYAKEYWLTTSDLIFRAEAERQGKFYSIEEFQNELNAGYPPTEEQITRFIIEN